MKRLVISIVFTLIILISYQFFENVFFSIDLHQKTSNELFRNLRYDPIFETEVVLIDIEYSDLDSVINYIDKLRFYEPKFIGINLCNIKDRSKRFDSYILKNKNIVLCNCSINSNNGTSRIINRNKEVTHFKTDKESYFELQLSTKSNILSERGNDEERIFFRNLNKYNHLKLSNLENADYELLNGKTILIGFIKRNIVTPMNKNYGEFNVVKGDMSDIEISANIISTINRSEFINEINDYWSAIIIITTGLVCIGLIRLFRTKYNFINFVIGLIILILLNGLTSAAIVFAFTKHYYLEINGTTIVLIVSAIAAVYWNTIDRPLPRTKC